MARPQAVRTLPPGVPERVVAAMAALERAGHPVYLAGATSRDLLFGRTPRQWDIISDARPLKLRAIFHDAQPVSVLGHSLPPTSAGITVSSYRMEADLEPGEPLLPPHPGPHVFVDLAHRDFTVEAVALPLRGEPVDPFRGQQDVAERRLRMVGNVARRLVERPVRMLRAVALAASYDLSFDRPLWMVLRELHILAEHMACDDVREQLATMLCGANAGRALEHLRQSGLLASLLPELTVLAGEPDDAPPETWCRTLAAVEAAEPHWALRLALLLHDTGGTRAGQRLDGARGPRGALVAQGVLRRLGYPADEVQAISAAIRHQDDILRLSGASEDRWRRWVQSLGSEAAHLTLGLVRARLKTAPRPLEDAAWAQAAAAAAACAEAAETAALCGPPSRRLKEEHA